MRPGESKVTGPGKRDRRDFEEFGRKKKGVCRTGRKT